MTTATVAATWASAAGATGGSWPANTALGVSRLTIDADETHVIAVTVHASTPTLTATPAGYTSRGSISHQSTGNATTYLYSVAGPVPAATIPLVISGNQTGRMSYVSFVLTGCNQSTTFQLVTTAAGATAPSVTATTGTMLLTVHGARETTAATPVGFTFTTPSGMALVGAASSTVDNGTTQSGTAVYSKTVTAGATTAVTASTSKTTLMGSMSVLVNPGTVSSSGTIKGTGFIGYLQKLGGLTHYYGLGDPDPLVDRIGAAHLTNQGGVTFNSSGATFTGAANSWLEMPDDPDFSIADQPRKGMMVLAFTTVTDWVQGSRDPNNTGFCHWLGKGDRYDRVEWMFRHYYNPDVTGSSRAYRMSAYAFNPTDEWGNGHLGAGSYAQVATSVNAERVLAATYNTTTTSLPDDSASTEYPGASHLNFNGGQVLDTDGFNGSSNEYLIHPQRTAAPVRIGTVHDGSKFKGIIRRIAFFDHELSDADINAIYAQRSLPDGAVTGSWPPPPAQAQKWTKPLGNALRLEIQGDPLPGALVNRVPNPSGELGGWGWSTPVVGTTMTSHQDSSMAWWLDFSVGTGGVATWFSTEPMPVASGRYVAASYQLTNAGAGFHRIRFEWLDTNQALLSASVQGSYIANNANTRPSFGSIQAPASTEYVRLRFDVYSTNAGAVPASGTVLSFNTVSVVDAATSAALGSSYINQITNPSFEGDVSGWATDGTASLTRDTSQHFDGVASARLQNSNAVTRTNLTRNPSVETTLNDWAAGSATAITRSNTSATNGSWCIRANGVAAGVSPWATLLSTQSIPVTHTGNPSNRVRVRADVRIGSTWDSNCKILVGVRWYDSASHLADSTYHAVDQIGGPSKDVWHTLDGTLAIPVGMTFCRVFVQVQNLSFVTSSDVFLVDSVLVEDVGSNTNPPGGYIDGSLTDTSAVTYDWFGTAHASTSTETSKIPAQGDSGIISTPISVLAGQYYAISSYVKQLSAAAPGYVRMTWAWYQGSTLLYWTTANAVLLTDTAWRRLTAITTAPANADGVTVKVGFDWGSTTSEYFVDAVQLELGQTVHAFTSGTFSSAAIPFVDPVAFVNVLGTSHDITVTRESLNVGTLSANIIDSTLDPSQSALIRPGRTVRLVAFDAATLAWRPLFTGTASHAVVSYVLAEPNAAKRAHIELTAVDAAQKLANQNRAEGVGTIAELPYVLEGAGVPWTVNGSGAQVGTAVVAAVNDSASALDQLAITRDSALGYAWVNRRGVVQVWDRNRLGTTLAGPVLDESVYRDVVVGYDTDMLINEVNLRFLRYNPSSGETEEVLYGPFRDEDSIREWGVRSSEFTVQGISEETSDLQGYAQAILDANAVPTVRLNSMDLTVDLASDWSGVTAACWWAYLDLYGLVSVTCGRASIAAQASRVTGIKHVISGPESKWLVELDFTSDTTVASPTLTPSPTPGAGGLTIGQLLRPVGEITMWHGAAAACPEGWLVCDGTTFDPVEYPALQTLLGTTTLPNFTDRFPIGSGTKQPGTGGGTPTVTLGTGQLPAHHHALGLQYSSNTATGGTSFRVTDINGQTGGGGSVATAQTQDTGSGNPVDILNPWRATWFIIRAR